MSKDSGTTWDETTNTVLTLSGLSSDSSYDSIRVQAGDADSWDGTRAVSCRTLPTTALAAPTSLVCTAAADSITLRWNPVSGATRYRAGRGHTWTTAPGTARQHTFGSLEAGTSHELRVQAGDADGWESVAAVKSCSTAIAPLSAPALRCISATSSSVTWGWAPVPGATGYRHRSTSTATWQTTTVPNPTGPTITFTATAAPGTLHQLHVQAKRGSETGADNYQVALTRQETPQGGTPQAAVIAHYAGKQTNTIADGINSTEYRALARARTSAGWTDWTPPATGQCPAPT